MIDLKSFLKTNPYNISWALNDVYRETILGSLGNVMQYPSFESTQVEAEFGRLFCKKTSLDQCLASLGDRVDPISATRCYQEERERQNKDVARIAATASATHGAADLLGSSKSPYGEDYLDSGAGFSSNSPPGSVGILSGADTKQARKGRYRTNGEAIAKALEADNPFDIKAAPTVDMTGKIASPGTTTTSSEDFFNSDSVAAVANSFSNTGNAGTAAPRGRQVISFRGRQMLKEQRPFDSK